MGKAFGITKFKADSGFTIVELLVTMGIIGVLAAIAIPQFAAYRAKAYCAAAKSDLANYSIAEEAYFTTYDAYTSVFSGPSLPGFKPTDGVSMTHLAGSPGKMAFTVVASHAACDEDKDGTTDVYTWDSTAGGLKF